MLGLIDYENFVAREDKKVQGLLPYVSAILAIKMVIKILISLKCRRFVMMLTSVNPETRRPVWHTDLNISPKTTDWLGVSLPTSSTIRRRDPIFDTRGSLKKLNNEHRKQLEKLEAVCSLAHHDKKISLYSPGYPTLIKNKSRIPQIGSPVLSIRQRRACDLWFKQFYCAIVPKGQSISASDLDYWDLEGQEDDSVKILRDLLPFMTSPEFTIKWTWQRAILSSGIIAAQCMQLPGSTTEPRT